MIKSKKIKMVFNIGIGIIFLVVILTFYSTFSLGEEYKFDSLVYDIKDGYIKNISSNTDVILFIKYFDMENCSIEVVDKDNNKIVSGLVVNGSKTVLYDNNHSILSSYVNIIKGDYTNDGVIDNNDFRGIGKCLIDDCSLEEYQKISFDINNDNEFHINDLTLLDNAITLGYTNVSLDKDSMILQSEEIGRLVAKVEPSYGLNQNLKWTSSNEEIATVDEAGRVTGHLEGETEIQAMTLDGKLVDKTTIKVDNTIQLLSYEGVAYIGGNDLEVGIKLIDYEGVTCSSSNEDFATCQVKDKKLFMTAKKQGNAIITVTSSNYGTATFKLTTYSVYLNVMPKYICMTPNNVQYITVSGFHSGKLSFAANDNEIIKNSYMEVISGRNMLKIQSGSKQGRAVLKVKEANGNSTDEVTIDVYRINTSEIGAIAKIGQEVSTTIVGDNLGKLSCISADVNKATCRIEGNQLIVTPLVKGSVQIEVNNQFEYNSQVSNCGKTQFLVVVQE